MATFAETIAYSRCQVLNFQSGIEGNLLANNFLEIANFLAIPVVTCDSQIVTSELLGRIENELKRPISQAIRSNVLVCGEYLEEQVSYAAHHLLIVGFDIRIVRDLVRTKNKDHADLHDRRLTHAGAVLTTSRQLVYEWAASEPSPNIRSHLASFIGKIDA